MPCTCSACWLIKSAETIWPSITSRQALRLSPDFPEAHNNLGTALMAQGKSAKRREFSASPGGKPDYVDAYNNLGPALTAQGKLDGSRGQLPATPASEARPCRGLQQSGQCPERAGELDEAIEGIAKLPAIRQAVRLKPDYAEAYNNLGNALKDQGNSRKRSPATSKPCA